MFIGFNTMLAKQYGLPEAILLTQMKRIEGEVGYANYRNFKYWYTLRELQYLMPFVSGQSVARLIKSMVRSNILLVDQPEVKRMNATKWYAISENIDVI